jgi:phage terminase small subunit
MSDKLTDKQRRFCEEYVIDLNGTQAAIRAGYSEKTANEQASRLLANVNASDYVKELQARLSDKLQISSEWVLKRFKEISDRAMTAEPVMIKVDGFMVESGEYQFDSAGANKATEMIGKHLGFFETHNKQKSTDLTGLGLTINKTVTKDVKGKA